MNWYKKAKNQPEKSWQEWEAEFNKKRAKEKEIILKALPNAPIHFKDNKWFQLGALEHNLENRWDKINEANLTQEEAYKAWDLISQGAWWKGKILNPNWKSDPIEKWKEQKKFKEKYKKDKILHEQPIDTFEHLQLPLGKKYEVLRDNYESRTIEEN